MSQFLVEDLRKDSNISDDCKDSIEDPVETHKKRIKKLEESIEILNETISRLLKTIENQQKAIDGLQKYIASFF